MKLIEKTLGLKYVKFRLIFAVILLSGMAFYGVANVQEQLQMTGEYSNPEQEYLFEWILKKTKPSNNFFY